MKRLVMTFAVILVLFALSVIGCTNKELAGATPEPGEEVVSTCVTCHTDKDILQETATVEEEAKSEATTGEG